MIPPADGHDGLIGIIRFGWKRPAVAAVTASGLIAGCGSGATPSSPPIAIAKSPQALAAVVAASAATVTKTVTVQMSLTDAGTFSTTPSPLRGKGTFDLAYGKGSLVLTPVVTHGHPRASQPTWTVVFLPKAAYSRPPRESKWELPRAKRWISIDLTSADTLSTNLPRYVAQIESLNPLISLDELRWGAKTAGAVGPMAVDGVRATEYGVTVDLQSALAKASGPNKTAFAAATSSLIRWLGGSPMTSTSDRTVLMLQVWVNAAGYVVKLQAASLVGVGTTTMVLRRSAAPVTVHPPALPRSIDIRSIGPVGERENQAGGDSDGA